MTSSNYLVLERVQVRSANASAGFTYGFPAISQFLGFVHALSRKFQQLSHGLCEQFDVDIDDIEDIALQGCAVMCHEHQVLASRADKFRDYHFAQTRNPLQKDGKTAPIIEEAKMNLCVSLIIEVDSDELDLSGSKEELDQLTKLIAALVPSLRMAGGKIVDVGKVYWKEIQDDTGKKRQWKSLLYRLMPGRLLVDRSAYLAQNTEHFAAKTQESGDSSAAFSAWLDFCQLRARWVEPKRQDPQTTSDTQQPASTSDTADTTHTEKVETATAEEPSWQYFRAPFPGYLVPVCVGYRRIAPLCAPGEVANARDASKPFAFTEAVHSIAEWTANLRKFNSFSELVWHYHAHDDYYLCVSRHSTSNSTR